MRPQLAVQCMSLAALARVKNPRELRIIAAAAVAIGIAVLIWYLVTDEP